MSVIPSGAKRSRGIFALTVGRQADGSCGGTNGRFSAHGCVDLSTSLEMTGGRCGGTNGVRWFPGRKKFVIPSGAKRSRGIFALTVGRQADGSCGGTNGHFSARECVDLSTSLEMTGVWCGGTNLPPGTPRRNVGSWEEKCLSYPAERSGVEGSSHLRLVGRRMVPAGEPMGTSPPGSAWISRLRSR